MIDDDTAEFGDLYFQKSKSNNFENLFHKDNFFKFPHENTDILILHFVCSLEISQNSGHLNREDQDL